MVASSRPRKTGVMSSTMFPGDLLVTEAQRERSLDYLQQAYAAGRLTEYEFDQRIGIVLGARTRSEMNVAFNGLAWVPMGRGASLVAPRPAGAPGLGGRALGGMAHLSSLATSAVGPAIVYGLSSRGSYARREAAKAFNFQVLSIVSAIAVSHLTGGFVEGLLMTIGVIGWLVLTLTGVARAFAGEDWRNPVTAKVPLKLLDEGRAPQKSLAPAWSTR